MRLFFIIFHYFSFSGLVISAVFFEAQTERHFPEALPAEMQAIFLDVSPDPAAVLAPSQ